MLLAEVQTNNTLPSGWGILSVLLGFIGAALGVFNAWRSFRKDRVRLRVKPQASRQYLRDATVKGTLPPDGPARMAIEVVNIGHLPAVISDVGLLTSEKDKRASASHYQTNLGKRLPILLEPRRAVTVVLDGAYNDLADHPVQYVGAYARTECGLEFRNRPHGFSDSFRDHSVAAGTSAARAYSSTT
jgi:hypothetical protein